MGGIGRPQRHTVEDAASQPLDVKRLMQLSGGGGGDGEQALAEDQEEPKDIQAKADQEG